MNTNATSVIKDNASVVTHMYEAFDRGDIEDGLAMLDPETVWEMTILEDVPVPGVFHGREGVRRFLTESNARFEFFDFVAEEYLESSGGIVVLGHERGRVKSTGKEFLNRWVHVFTMQNGMVTHFRGYGDTAGMYIAMQTDKKH